jgi:hypothetical protein
MLRLTLLLCFGILVALFTMGEDRGQLRPGLAKAEAEGRLDEVWAEARTKAAPAPAPVAATAPEPVTIIEAVAEPLPEPVAPPKVTLPSTGPAIEGEAGRNVASWVDGPVFTLSALGNQPVPGEDGAPLEVAVSEALAETGPAPALNGGTIWYVSAESVNVRSGPSTDAEILDRLGAGEAALLVAVIDSDWAQIVIQGDGVEGYVALRYLSPSAP